MTHFLRSQRGSSSILVAMILIILLVFAGLSLATSTANRKLAQKNAETTTLYYSLDSEGERVLYEIKKCLRESTEWADQTLQALKAGKVEGLDLPEALAATIRKNRSLANNAGSDQWDNWYAQLADYHARKTIEAKYPGCIEDNEEPLDLSGGENAEPVLGFMFRRTIILDHKGIHRYLNLSIRVDAPEIGTKPEMKCQVLEWRLWQEPFEYSNQIDLWEGKP